MPRLDREYLADILEAVQEILRELQGFDKERFEGSSWDRSATLFSLSIIGEAANRVSEELKESHSEIPWRRMVSMRNQVVHAYFAVDWEIVWETVQHDLPPLEEAISRILNIDSPKGLL